MEPLVSHEGLVAPLDRDNVDTDAIMPKQFMKSIARTGFGPYLFDEWRYRDPGYYGKPAAGRTPEPGFVLNQPRYAGASVLLARRNFGCGSSREHAPWALHQYGFRVLIAESFADIFFNNCCKNGLLPVRLDAARIDRLMAAVDASPGYRLRVDLAAQTVTTPDGDALAFDLAPALKTLLLEGLDETGATLAHADAIRAFEAAHLERSPWL
ncbi:3-isopropylmalate dehydratase small subunit [Paraburkholderia caballeronis]|uniref:3-isopropylmalate dehydratase small subunit n=1 Tax=Paraburkholderia caballeronis TaxID=416943 RepID=A0A1H7FZX1_9BURK|nr:3-isopropylmalate dehydratase small subunit [Paraburkholderia caballeronis]PXW24769.1 3-isopropylmalate dehydratase small subunit [Paraburkholderia caballeronis]PXX00499.1 3-isopropylmalate dehydratase small subunit [Paraburkholderia caballeronis]RAJ98562.1 3-isopropylmalate dehydratase small subunit [Paraburkholderia caballeronis]TDV16616.1 3-isopropylmalate dehydratase small subunit [Paraburkholderia caballeronis]TDV19012.1 3-isopropylmalate dehydratase small subunit [Paraburkholderia cab